MSDTRRWTQPGWDAPWCESKKHQQRDRAPVHKSQNRFCNMVKNSYVNLKEKIYDLMDKEYRDEG